MNNVNQDPGSRGRNPRGEGDRLRATLLEAATALLAESEDPDSVSVRAVTRRARVSPTALYLHFENREELFRTVSEECFAERLRERRRIGRRNDRRRSDVACRLDRSRRRDGRRTM